MLKSLRYACVSFSLFPYKTRDDREGSENRWLTVGWLRRVSSEMGLRVMAWLLVGWLLGGLVERLGG